MLLCAATVLVVSTTARAATPGQQQVTRDFQKTLSLPSGQSFRIENKFGEIRIHGESSREVKISATIRTQADSREQAQSFADKVQIEVQQTAQGIEVRTQYPETPAIGSAAKTLPIPSIMKSPLLPIPHSW